LFTFLFCGLLERNTFVHPPLSQIYCFCINNFGVHNFSFQILLFFIILPYSLHNEELRSMIVALMMSMLCAPGNQAEQLCALELENLQLRHGLEEARARSKEKESHAQR
jgi:hypothetical protein